MEDKTRRIIEAEKTDEDYFTRKYNALEKKQKQITERKPKRNKTLEKKQKQITESIFEINIMDTEEKIVFFNSLIGVYEKIKKCDVYSNVSSQKQYITVRKYNDQLTKEHNVLKFVNKDVEHMADEQQLNTSKGFNMGK